MFNSLFLVLMSTCVLLPIGLFELAKLGCKKN